MRRQYIKQRGLFIGVQHLHAVSIMCLLLQSRLQKYILERIDEDNCDLAEDILNLVARNNGFNVKVVTAGAWPCTVSSLPYCEMKVPKQLTLIQSEFESFYRALHNSEIITSDGLAIDLPATSDRKVSRRLHWCYGLGSISLDCYHRGKLTISAVVNESQAALLLLFNNSSRPYLFVKKICRDLNFRLRLSAAFSSPFVIILTS